MAGARVVVVGSYVQDHAWFCDVFPRDGESRRANGFNTGPGGKGFNQAVACHRQGVATTFIGALGEDRLGDIARGFARDEGLDARWQDVGDAPTAASSILVDASGANRIVVNLGANERLDAGFVREQLADLADMRIALCQLENGLEAIAAALDAATSAGALRILNPAPMHPDFALATLDHVDILTPNETEFALLCRLVGRDVDPDRLAALDDASLHDLVRALPARTVVITLGAQGCFVSHPPGPEAWRGDTRPCYRLAPEPARAVDTTGAGDSFSGALAAALLLLEDEPFARAVRHANRAAAMSTETVGTAPAMPSHAQVVARFGDPRAGA